jgi:hypothetical protein
MKKPSKSMIIALLIGILAVLGVTGWWWHSVCAEEDARRRAAAESFDRAKRAGEAADRNVRDTMNAAQRYKNN